MSENTEALALFLLAFHVGRFTMKRLALLVVLLVASVAYSQEPAPALTHSQILVGEIERLVRENLTLRSRITELERAAKREAEAHESQLEMLRREDRYE